MDRRLTAVAAAFALVGGAAVAREADSADWHKVATNPDRERLKQWRDAWTAGLADAGPRREIVAEGALFDPDRALERPLPPPGAYRCRVFKLGRKAESGLPFVSYPPFRCEIEEAGAVLKFAKLDGSQRPRGRIYAGDNARAVFLGTLVLGDETRHIPYGRDTARNMAGIVERIGDRRWRIAFPYPAFESKIDVMELVPAS